MSAAGIGATNKARSVSTAVSNRWWPIPASIAARCCICCALFVLLTRCHLMYLLQGSGWGVESGQRTFLLWLDRKIVGGLVVRGIETGCLDVDVQPTVLPILPQDGYESLRGAANNESKTPTLGSRKSTGKCWFSGLQNQFL